MFPAPPHTQFWRLMFPYLAAGLSQGSPPSPHVQTESNCFKLIHWFKLENGSVLVRRGEPQMPWGQWPCPLALGEGAPHTILVSSRQALLVIA